jgi:hypothetical protein
MHANTGSEEDQTKLIAPRDGIYETSAGVIWALAPTADPGSRQLEIRRNGSQEVAAEQVSVGMTMNDPIQNVSGMIPLRTGDYVQAFLSQSTGGSVPLYQADDQRIFFAMRWVAPYPG